MQEFHLTIVSRGSDPWKFQKSIKKALLIMTPNVNFIGNTA
jgi:hypothetical protein